MDSTQNFQAEAVSRTASASSNRLPAASRRRPGVEPAARLTRLFGPLRQKAFQIQERLADVFADRSALLAKIAILEHDIQRVQKFANHDELTGLPNRRLLEDHYRMAVVLSERQQDSVALLFIDIDRFKNINDAYGHDFADRILRQLALRLSACIRASDTACRYGGDEFIVLLSGNQERAAAVAMAEKIRERLCMPYVIDSRTIELEVSVGMAVRPFDGPELASLIKAADREMYRRKGESAKDLKSRKDRVMENDAFTNEGAPPEAN